ncbi:hypothetical protein [Paenibacillus sp. PK1-4R]|uniref:hypothetical protein n=1 Tax=Paenibacillus sp. PK1-4R TaxID=3049075 RepID=UPI0025A02763|nr:hypothetical protein [Paenibacillus sp. PK1-4R]WJM08369.1 hypothetical protein QNO02_29970 [Paenibacillus sp. PK1-4R]
MKFSSLKRDILLIIIRDYDMALIIDTIKEYLNITTEQAFHSIDYLISSKWVDFKEGRLIITLEGTSKLEHSNLDSISFEGMNELKYVVDESVLGNYVPKKL